MTAAASLLPPGVTVFERGWLSANNILIVGTDDAALIDSGYGSHAGQTVALVRAHLAGRPLDRLLNTHLHSDHCGGNAALQAAYPPMSTLIPPGQARHVREWNPQALTYTPTGQNCPRFTFTELLQPGACIRLGDRDWQVHAAPGHDPHSVVLFEPQSRALVSADALWESGFGVVFPELEGTEAFSEVGATLDLIEALDPAVVIPGHGRLFTTLAQALVSARRRLDDFERHPDRHVRHAAKVLLKFKLLEWQVISGDDLAHWAQQTAYLRILQQTHAPDIPFDAWIDRLLDDLIRSGAAKREDRWIANA